MSTTVPAPTTTPVTGSRLFPNPDAARKIYNALEDFRTVVELALLQPRGDPAGTMDAAVTNPDRFLARGFTHDDRTCLVFVAFCSQY